MPIDEAYSRDLAHELAKVALSARGLPHAAADILPLARELYRQSRRAVPGLLFAAVGLDNLSGADLCKYAYCTQDKALRAKAFKSALAPVGPGVPTKGLLNVHLIVAYAEAGNVAEAEAEAEALVADPSAAEGNEANGAYALACALAAAGDKEDAARWFGFVVSRFPETVFAQLSQKNLANGRSSEKEARER